MPRRCGCWTPAGHPPGVILAGAAAPTGECAPAVGAPPRRARAASTHQPPAGPAQTRDSSEARHCDLSQGLFDSEPASLRQLLDHTAISCSFLRVHKVTRNHHTAQSSYVHYRRLDAAVQQFNILPVEDVARTPVLAPLDPTNTLLLSSTPLTPLHTGTHTHPLPLPLPSFTVSYFLSERPSIARSSSSKTLVAR